MDKQLIPVFVGILGALLGVYMREALRRSVQQKMIATRIDAYLQVWNREIQQYESVFNIYIVGISNRQKIATVLTKRGRDADFSQMQSLEQD